MNANYQNQNAHDVKHNVCRHCKNFVCSDCILSDECDHSKHWTHGKCTGSYIKCINCDENKCPSDSTKCFKCSNSLCNECKKEIKSLKVKGIKSSRYRGFCVECDGIICCDRIFCQRCKHWVCGNCVHFLRKKCYCWNHRNCKGEIECLTCKKEIKS